MGDEVRVLRHAVDQAGDVLDHVHAAALDRPTPCADWDVATLADHLVATPGRFLAMMRGAEVDWSAPPPHVTQEWGPAFRSPGDDLVHAWHQQEGADTAQAAWQIAELAVHAWDLATATGYPLDRLDPEVAEVGLAFLRTNLTDDARGPAFGPERPAAADAGPYERIAAFAGRRVT